MCLQWCHVTRQLIDNDLPCDHCPAILRYAHQGRTCAGCRHLAGNLCTLTHGETPRAACCHRNCTPDRGLLQIGPDQLAAGLLERYGACDMADLFDGCGSANGCNDAVSIPLDDLAVPEVYGLSADEWDYAFRERISR